ncbi:unnamed protein product [Parascedosporium putredinis]|uniref:Uncharacterized protein n=1 Tax=Parascedosporium putredinis TaxID=1442378 RepID=A0A9P1MDN2_9PEZI|nr:unnamed protein product [Parascedosporium putredinis]CAI8002966.1 unnamed protein product [Parascedosporium putredinis]
MGSPALWFRTILQGPKTETPNVESHEDDPGQEPASPAPSSVTKSSTSLSASVTGSNEGLSTGLTTPDVDGVISKALGEQEASQPVLRSQAPLDAKLSKEEEFGDMFWNAVNERHEEVNDETPVATGKKELTAQGTETESDGTTPDLLTTGRPICAETPCQALDDDGALEEDSPQPDEVSSPA